MYDTKRCGKYLFQSLQNVKEQSRSEVGYISSSYLTAAESEVTETSNKYHSRT